VRVISLREILADGEVLQAYKKKALSAGIAGSRGQLIVTTDADCIAGPDWLRTIAAIYERNDASMIIGPVAYTPALTLVGVFQELDFMTMQGITVAARQLRMGSMANGANLAFSREAFGAVNGYSGIDHLASGDDYLLLHKMQQQFSHRIHYLKSSEAIIRTAPQPDWGSFLQQRIRWASKSGKYPDHRLTAVLLLVYLFNVSILVTTIAGFWLPELFLLAAGMLIVKTIAELIFLLPVAGFFGNRKRLWIFPLLQPLHVCYIVLAGFLGMWGGYRWKGRAVN
jgi:cellulose synthase/poly-beta-1,6-N-acetylglucosamine synthase-like glycosyltransferase